MNEGKREREREREAKEGGKEEDRGKRDRERKRRAPKEGDSQISSARKNLITKFRGER